MSHECWLGEIRFSQRIAGETGGLTVHNPDCVSADRNATHRITVGGVILGGQTLCREDDSEGQKMRYAAKSQIRSSNQFAGRGTSDVIDLDHNHKRARECSGIDE